MKLVGIIAIVLAMSVASAAMAATVTCTINNLGNINQYNYTLASKEAGDYLTCFHIYSPASVSSILSGWADTGWEYGIDFDPYTGGSDIYWYMPAETGRGLEYNQTLTVHITTSANVPTINNFIVPDYMGNWGYDSEMWSEYGTVVMDTSVAVPNISVPAQIPEPTSLLALGLGCALLKLRRRR